MIRRHPPTLALALGACVLAGACALRHDMGPIPPCGEAPLQRIPWWGPIDPAERSANDARCQTVGVPVVVPRTALGFGSPASGDSLVVVSWNLAVGGADLLSFLREAVGLTCEGSTSHPGPGFRHVILLLQEAHRHADDLPPMDDPRLAGSAAYHARRPGGDLDIAETAARCGLALAYVPSGRNGPDHPDQRRGDKGNAILSTLPLDVLAAVEVPFETERKVVLVADAVLPQEMRIRFVVVHLDVSSSFRRVLLSGNQNRSRQARGVLEALADIERTRGTSPPTLVGGDFNTWSGHEAALRLFRAEFPDSPPWEGKSTRGVFPTDHVFYRRGDDPGVEVDLIVGSFRRLEVRSGSDHQPVLLWLRLGGEDSIR